MSRLSGLLSALFIATTLTTTAAQAAVEVTANGEQTVYALSFEDTAMQKLVKKQCPGGGINGFLNSACDVVARNRGDSGLIEIALIQNSGTILQIGSARSVAARVTAPFSVIDDSDPSDPTSKVVRGLISGNVVAEGLTQSFTNIGAFAVYGAKVELFNANNTIVASEVVMLEGCSSGVPNGLEAAEPCSNYVSNDVPISFPVLLEKGQDYTLAITAACDTRAGEGGVLPAAPSGCESISLTNRSNPFSPTPAPFLTTASAFTLSVDPSIPNDVTVPDLSSLASQASVNLIQEDVALLINGLASLQEDSDARYQGLVQKVDTLALGLETRLSELESILLALEGALPGLEDGLSQNTDDIAEVQAGVTELLRLVKLPLGQRKKQ